MSARDRSRSRRSRPATPVPAFGRALLDARRKGLVPNPPECYVCLDNWKWRKSRTRVVVAPEHDPAALDYSMLAALDVFALYDRRVSAVDRRDALLRALVRANPQRIIVLDMDPDNVAPLFFVKSAAVGVERQEYA